MKRNQKLCVTGRIRLKEAMQSVSNIGTKINLEMGIIFYVKDKSWTE